MRGGYRGTGGGGGGLTPAQIAEDAMLALGPSHQFRADTVTLNTGNVATVPNRRGSGALAIASGTLAAPAPDALFGGAQSIVFGGTQWLDSNLPANTWRFLHDGTGCTVFTVFAPVGVAAGSAILLSTRFGGFTGFTQYRTGNQLGMFVQNGSSVIVSATGGTLATGAPTYTEQSMTTGLYQSYLRDSVVAAGVPTGPTDLAGPQGTLRLGARTDGSGAIAMRWCETLVFTRDLREYESQIVREYIAARYGIAAPSLTGADRDILSLLPFSWFDAAFFNTSGGKVTAFRDRAMPGHLYSQATVANQVVDPTVDATLGGALAAVFANNEFYDSNLPPAAWRFFHGDGPGMETYDAVVFTDSAAAHIVRGTYGVPGSQAQGGGSSQVAAAVYNAAGNIGNVVIPSAISNGVAERLRTRITATQIALKSTGLSEFAATLTGVPFAGDPGGSLRLGGRPASDATVRLTGRYAGMVVFDRQLTAPERVKIDAAMLAKYGVPP
jgi:hypothetical protein